MDDNLLLFFLKEFFLFSFVKGSIFGVEVDIFCFSFKRGDVCDDAISFSFFFLGLIILNKFENDDFFSIDFTSI